MSIIWTIGLALAFLSGCQQVSRIAPSSTWHQQCGWKAEDYFDDPKVIALCKAIEANDLAEIDRIVASGANVKAIGKGKMTPLLWAFPDNKLERFQRLLEHGGDPNVVVDSDFNTRGGIAIGDSVTHLVCKTAFPGYFEAVFVHGGDANLVTSVKHGMKDSPLFTVIKGNAANKIKMVQVLVGKGADLNYQNATGITPTIQAVSWGAQYDIALALLNAGADHKVCLPNSNSRLVHRVVEEELRLSQLSQEKKVEYERLAAVLTVRGESLEEAKKDKARWRSWSRTGGEYQRKMAEEVAARMAREAQEKEAKQADNKRINPRQD